MYAGANMGHPSMTVRKEGPLNFRNLMVEPPELDKGGQPCQLEKIAGN
jgi:hypothetical protein